MPTRRFPESFDGVLFDIDGTLVDSLGMLLRGLGDTFEKFTGDRPSDEEIRELVGLPLTEQMRRFGLPDPTPAEADHMTQYAIGRFKVHEAQERPFGPAVEALRVLHRAQVPTVLVTSKNAQELNDFLDRFEARAAVTSAVCADDVLMPKPHPDSALLACRRIGIDPSRAIMVGDSIYDMRCAKAAGVTTAAVGYGAAPADVIRQEEPDLFFETPQALLDWAHHHVSNLPCPVRS